MLCMFAAMVFWFFNALNKNYSTNLNFPVTFEYDQERYVPIESLPSTVRMNVSGSGWDLFRRSLGFKVSPLVIPLEKPAEVQKIVAASLPAFFADQLERLKINFIITDTIHIGIDEKIRTKFKVRLDSIQRYIDPEFGLMGALTIQPDTVWLEGPRSAVNKIPATLQLTLQQTNIRREFNENVELPLGQNKLITAQPQKINVLFDVEKFVLVDKQIKLSIINIPPQLKQSSLTREVSCTYRLPVSTSETFTGDSLKAVVDLNSKRNGTYKLVPQITGLPPNAVVIKTDTVLINF